MKKDVCGGEGGGKGRGAGSLSKNVSHFWLSG